MRCNGSMLQFHAAVGLDQNLAWLSCAGWWHGGTVFAPHIAAFEIHIPGREKAKTIIRRMFELQGKNGFPVQPKKIAAHC